MVTPEEATFADGDGSAWRDRTLDRSLTKARARAVSRSHRFIKTAMEILEETGRTDFTMQELVDRAHSSLRTFYQYFAGKDELLLALLEETITDSVAEWRKDIERMDAVSALEFIIQRIYGSGSGTDRWLAVNRAVASYHVGLAEAQGPHYRRALSPLLRILAELVQRGVEDGALRTDIPVKKLIPAVVQIVVGSSMLNALDHDKPVDPGDWKVIWAVCRAGLLGSEATPARPARAAARKATAKR